MARWQWVVSAVGAVLFGLIFAVSGYLCLKHGGIFFVRGGCVGG